VGVNGGGKHGLNAEKDSFHYGFLTWRGPWLGVCPGKEGTSEKN
jgi:hypothetical protein